MSWIISRCHAAPDDQIKLNALCQSPAVQILTSFNQHIMYFCMTTIVLYMCFNQLKLIRHTYVYEFTLAYIDISFNFF